MNKKQVLATASVAVLLFSAIAGLQFVRLATANFLPPPPPTVKVYIRNDGSVDPETTPIQRFGNVYVFTDNLLNHTLEVQCDNIVVDGASFTLKGVGVNAGITLSGRSNVTIKNIDIRNYVMSVWLNMSSNNTITSNRMLTFFNVILDSSSNNQITGNDITGQDTGYGYGVQVNSGSFNNTIVGNIFTDTGIGVRVEGGDYNLISGNYFIRGGTSVLARGYYNVISKNSMVDGRGGISVTGPGSYNTIFGNNITGKSKCGIKIYWGSSNTVYENHVANSAIGVKLGFDYEFPDRKVENNVFYHNNFVNNTQYVFIGYTPNSNFWDNGKEGNYWSNYNGTDSNGDGIGDRPYIINADNQDNYPLMEPVVILVIEIPEIPDGEKPTTLPTDPSPTSQLPPSPPFIAMPEEYINYTISRVNGSLWAKIDGTYPLYVSYEKSGSDDLSKLDDTSLLVTSDELPMFYPTPPGTTSISVKMNETELDWSNHTKTHPKATHHTAIGDWPMIYCTIHPVPDHFILKIHYEHPITLINGSYTFLYDLNISPYLSPWCNKSTAYFNIRMETKYEDFNVYTTGSEEWNPVNYTLTKENTAEIVSIKIISEYDKPLLGDLAVTFTDAKESSLVDYSYVIIAVIGVAIASVAGYQFLKRIDMRFNDKHVRARGAAVKTFAAVSVLLFLIVAGTLLIDVGTANPLPTTSTISVISPQQNKVYTVNNVPLTVSNTIEIAGTFPIGKQLIKYYLDGELKGQIESKLTRDSPTETFSFNLTALSDGLHGVTVSVHGGYSNSFLENVYFTVDTTPPRISIRAPLDRTYNATEVPLNFIAREPVSWMGYSLDAQANVTITGNTTLSELSYGSHNLTVYANDIAGNMGYSRTIYFSIAQKKEPKQPEPQQSEPFPTWIIATMVIVAVVGVSFLVYFRKIRKTTGEVEKTMAEGVV